MAHSIELLFDEHTDALLRQMWDTLTEADLPSQAKIRSGSNRPHVTLTVAERIDGAVDNQLAAVVDRLPLPCVVGAPLLFGAGRFTLARLIVPSAELLALHAEVDAVSTPYRIPHALPHAEPGRWTPHATLGRRMNADQVAAALTALRDSSADVLAHFTGMRRWDSDAKTEHALTGS